VAGLGKPGLLVARIGLAPVADPSGLVCHRPGRPIAVPDLAQAYAHHTSLALGAVMERDNLNRAVAHAIASDWPKES
jgi:hypothetical protein